MKTLNLLTTLTLFVAGLGLGVSDAYATPSVDTLNVQGYMKKANGTAVTDGSYTMVFGVFQNGTALWAKQYTVSVTNGLFTQALSGTGTNETGLGAGTAMNVDYSAVTLNPALLSGATAGEVAVRIYSQTAIDGANPQFDIALGAVPTAFIAKVAQGVEAGSVPLTGIASGAKSNVGGGGAAGLLALLNGSGQFDTTMIPNLPASTINSGQIGVANGGTGSTDGSIISTGSPTYQSSATGTTTIGNGTSTASTVVQAGSGGISETTSGNYTVTPGAAGNVTIGTAVGTGTTSIGNAGGTSGTALTSGSGGILLSTQGAGLVRIANNGLNLNNGAGTVTIKSATSGSYNFILPPDVGTGGYVLTTDGTVGTATATWADPMANLPTKLATPPAIGGTTPSTGAFTTLSATGPITSTQTTGVAPFVVASTTNVANLNASSLNGATFAAPGAIGGTTAGTGAFTTVTATSVAVGGGSALGTYLENQTCNLLIAGATTAGAGTYTTNVCRYTQIGKRIELSAFILTTAHTGTGNMTVTGLPVASLNVAGLSQVCFIGHSALTIASGSSVKGVIAPNSTTISLMTMPATTVAEAAVAMDVANTLYINCSYMTN